MITVATCPVLSAHINVTDIVLVYIYLSHDLCDNQVIPVDALLSKYKAAGLTSCKPRIHLANLTFILMTPEAFFVSTNPLYTTLE